MTAPSLRSTTRYVNAGHAFAHLLMLIFPPAGSVRLSQGMAALGGAPALPRSPAAAQHPAMQPAG